MYTCIRIVVILIYVCIRVIFLTLKTIGYSWDLFGWVLVYGPKWPFILMYISLDVDWDKFVFG